MDHKKYFDQIIDAATLINSLCDVGPLTSDRAVRIISDAICDASLHLRAQADALQSAAYEVDQ